MNLINVNYLEKTTLLIKEAFTLKKYKAMPLVFAIIIGIGMLPLFLLSIPFFVQLCLLGFLFEIIKTPVKFLHSLLKSEGSEVKHATQFIIYLISWPLLFFLYALLAVNIIYLAILYAISTILLYTWTLGGFKFNLFISDDDISITITKRYNKLALIGAIIVLCLLVVIPFVDVAFNLNLSYRDNGFWTFYFPYIRLNFWVLALYSLIFWSKEPKSTATPLPSTDVEEEQ